MRNGFSKLKRKILIGVAFVVAGLLLSLAPSVKGARAEPLRVGVSKSAHSALIYLADAEGFFKKWGLDVAIEEYEAGVLAVDDLIANKVEIATAPEFVFVSQSFKHPDLRLPASISMSSVMDLIVRKDRGIARPQDLKGKRISVVRAGQPEFFLHNYIIFNGIPAESVQVVYDTPSEMVKAMAKGTLDAALCWPPYTTTMAKQLGAKVARWPAQSGQDYYFAVFAREGFLKKQPKAMEQFMAALHEAEAYIGKYPVRAKAILLERLKTDVEPFLATWSRASFRLQLTQDLLVLMEREAKWAMRNNLLEEREMPNYLDFFHFDALDKVRPEAVSIVH